MVGNVVCHGLVSLSHRCHTIQSIAFALHRVAAAPYLPALWAVYHGRTLRSEESRSKRHERDPSPVLAGVRGLVGLLQANIGVIVVSSMVYERCGLWW